MKFLLSSILALSVVAVLVAAAPSLQSSHTEEVLGWGKSKTCQDRNITTDGTIVKEHTCKLTANLKKQINDDCFESTYLKVTVEYIPPRDVPATNGAAQCTRTPCDATEKISVDCATAFGDKLSQIEK